MKVSKPVLIVLVVAIGFVVYLYVFAGKKTPPPPVQQPQPQAQGVQAPGAAAPQPPVPAPPGGTDPSKQAVMGAAVKPDPSAYARSADIPKTRTDWRDDPFLLPNVFDKKSLAQERVAQKVLAILDGRKGRIAVIDQEVVKRGDVIGLERITEIKKDRVVLSRGSATRTIVLEDPAQKIFSVQEKSSGEGK